MTAQGSTVPILRMRGITKRFPGVVANEDVDLTVLRGEIHGLLGENGAGKSTLMNLLYGLHQPDEGTIEIDGRTVAVDSPKAALEQGIGMVHQHFMLVPTMTVAENMALGLQGAGLRPLRLRDVTARLRDLSQQHSLHIDPEAVVEDLSVGGLQRLEVLKLLYRGAELLVLDEPTAVLAPPEWEELAKVLRGLTEQGKAVILITHKLDELCQAADRCTVLRDGRVTGVVDLHAEGGRDKAALARLMVGRDVELRMARPEVEVGPPVLAVDEVCVEADGGAGRPVLDRVSLEVRAGEILGIAGVDGNGQRELVEVLTGLRTASSGTLNIDGRPCDRFSPRDFMAAGGAVIPEDRHRRGVAAELSVLDNLMMKDFDRPPFVRRGLVEHGVAREHCGELVDRFRIRTPSLDVPLAQLSGGNQQRAVLAREMHRQPKLLIAAQPTRGLDVGAMEFVYEQVLEHKRRGGATLLVSAELEEVLSLSDRVAVMYEGRLLRTMPVEQASAELVGMLMAGQEVTL